MVFSGWFKIDFLEVPAHGPVDTPDELGAFQSTQIAGLAVSAAITVIGKSPIAVPSVDLRRVAIAVRAEYSHRPPFALDFMVFIPVFIENGFQMLTHLEGAFHAFSVSPRPIAVRLVDKFGINADLGQNRFNIHFMMPGVRFVAPPRIGNHGDGESEIFLQEFWLRHVERDFSENVIVVPAVNEANVLASVAERAHNQLD